MKPLITLILLYVLPVLLLPTVRAQGALQVSPGKLTFNQFEGTTQYQELTVFNPTDEYVEIEFLLEDWKRDSSGLKVYAPPGSSDRSCAAWVHPPGQRIKIPPQETRFVRVSLDVPATYTPEQGVHHAMLFLRQVRPFTSDRRVDALLTSDIDVLFQVGVHIYYTHPALQRYDLTIQHMEFTETGQLRADYENTGETLIDAKIKVELTDVVSGREFTGKNRRTTVPFLPGDYRRVFIDLTEFGLPSGRYSALVSADYGADYELEVGILEIIVE